MKTFALNRIMKLLSGISQFIGWIGVGPSQPIDIMFFMCEIWPILGLKAPILPLKRSL
jgi:hypothetical protein